MEAMRRLALLLLLALAGCDAPEEYVSLVTLESQDTLGMSLRELPKATLGSLGLGYGLAVIRLGAPAERAGLRVGDVVYGVNQTKFRNLQEFSKAITKPAEGRVSLLVRRGKTDFYVPMEIGTVGAPDVFKGPRPTTETLLRT
jgi:membrane-associated protease RseP (regulator of RpoE activity)